MALPKLCKAGQQLREQIDDDYPDRDRRSDGWIADARHLAKGSSDHIPVDGIVRALDIDADLSAHPGSVLMQLVGPAWQLSLLPQKILLLFSLFIV